MMAFFYIILVVTFLFFLMVIGIWKQVSSFDQVRFQPQEPGFAIILGASLQRGKISPALQERLDFALTLYHAGWLEHILCTGGQAPGRKGKKKEAEAMSEYLQAHGVPKQQIFLEKKSKNTWENLHYSQEILQKHSTPSPLYLITHDFHMKRGLLLAKRSGLSARPAPFSSTTLWLPYHKTREALALVKSFLLDR